MTTIRPARPDDLEALYEIALKTGDAGKDASSLYADPKLLGHIYAAPYLIHEPQACFVAEDEEGVVGYIVGARNTQAFAELLEAEWWRKLRRQYVDPSDLDCNTWTPDQLLSFLIHHPFKTPQRIVDTYPSHLHINLLPRAQGQGLGAELMDRFLMTMDAAGSRGVHLGVHPENDRALRFYENYGFREVKEKKHQNERHTIWFRLAL